MCLGWQVKRIGQLRWVALWKSQEPRAKSQEPRASERGDARELEKKQRVVRPEGRPEVRATEVCVKRQCHVRLKCVRLETESRALELCAVGDRTTSAWSDHARNRHEGEGERARKERILEYQCCDRDSSELCGIVEVLKKAQDRTSEGRG